jgi:carboxyl-terminal processing protease
VQSLLPLGPDAALKLTTARYFTPSGKSVQEGGIKPDIAVPQISDPDYMLRQKYQTRESDLRGHLINELGIKDEEMEADSIADPRFQLTSAQLEEQGVKDFQLHYAMETLRRTTKSTVALRPARR